MAGWHRCYNVSGNVHCGERIDDWCRVLRNVFQTDEIGTIGHFTGAVSVFVCSPIGDLVSCGQDLHEFWALVSGERADWLRFAAILESALTAAALPYALTVHDLALELE